MDPVLARIRAHRFGIAGYACRFDRLAHRENGPEIVRKGAFSYDSITNRYLALRVNHEVSGQPLASIYDGTLHVSADGLGLWFEASLPETAAGAALFIELSRFGSLPVSLGSCDSTVSRVQGVRVLTDIVVDEISILRPPRTPGRPGTWAKPNAAAQEVRMQLFRNACGWS